MADPPVKTPLFQAGQLSKAWWLWFQGLARDVVGIAKGGTGQTTAAAAFSALKQDASATATGVVELATDAETVTGTDTARAVTPANLTAKMSAPGSIGGTTPATAFHVATKTPASAAAAGTAGQIAWDSSYIYVCVAANSWKRVAIAAW